VTASPSNAPRQPSGGGLEAWKQALASRVTRDVDTAGADAKRQIEELRSNTIRRLEEMRRVWHTVTQAFSDTAVDQVQHEAAATEIERSGAVMDRVPSTMRTHATCWSTTQYPALNDHRCPQMRKDRVERQRSGVQNAASAVECEAESI